MCSFLNVKNTCIWCQSAQFIWAETETTAEFQINSISVVTFSINNNIKFLENIKQGFKKAISWNKYRSEVTTQPKINNVDYVIDPKFSNINGMFILTFKGGKNDPKRDCFDKY